MLIKKKHKTYYILSLLTMFVCSLLLFTQIAFAAPDDDEDDVEVIDYTQIVESVDEHEASLEENEIEINPDDYEDGDVVYYEGEPIVIHKDEADDDESKDNEGTVTITETTEESITRAVSEGAFTAKGNGTIRDIIQQGPQTFYVIEADDGAIFYLLIDDTYGDDAVYLLSAVDAVDLAGYIASGDETVTESNTSTTSETTITLTDEEYAELYGDEESQTSESDSGSSSNAGLIAIIVIVVAIVILALIYRSRKGKDKDKKKKTVSASSFESEGFDADDFINESEDEEEPVNDDINIDSDDDEDSYFGM